VLEGLVGLGRLGKVFEGHEREPLWREESFLSEAVEEEKLFPLLALAACPWSVFWLALALAG